MPIRPRLVLLLLLIALVSVPGIPRKPAVAEPLPGPIRFIPENPDSWTKVDARFAPKPDVCPARQPGNLHAGYPGIVEVGRRADGRLYIVTELSFPRYLKGIAEVPRDWPIDALKAQVVAARTYAMSHLDPSTEIARELRYNLCATDACQVYRGLIVERGAWGDRWQTAVNETGGEILVHRGEPAQTFYYSTSNGQTYSNTDAFGGSPIPYLKPVQEADDRASPYTNWSVRMPLNDLTETLKRSGDWNGPGIEDVRIEAESVHLAGGGQNGALTIQKFRGSLNAHAVCLTPKRYPTPSSTGRPLPQVLPSKWFGVRREGTDAIFEGRGWGHGVGMVQWGLKAKAEKGMSYADMLAFYYGGLRPTRREEPGTIRIGLAVDVEELMIERHGDVKVEGGSLPRGPLRLRGGATLDVTRAGPIEPQLRLEKVAAPPTVSPEAAAAFTFELSGPANVRLRYEGAGAKGESGIEPRDRGAQSLPWSVAGLPPGDYSVTVVANDGVDEVAAGPLAVTVAAPPSPSPSPTVSPSPSPSPSPRASGPVSAMRLLLAVGALVGLTMLGTMALFLGRRRRA